MESVLPRLFPYSAVRPAQNELLAAVYACIGSGRNLVVHAPTGIGKTAASIVPCLEYGKEKGKVVLFLTSRQTQHRIAIETVREIIRKGGEKVSGADIIGKQSMCLMQGIGALRSSEFNDFCENAREEKKCRLYSRTFSKGELTPLAASTSEELIKSGPMHAEEVVELCRRKELCPYEISSSILPSADIIIADYYHVFNQHIRELLLGRMARFLQDCILIVDEGHNLGPRLRELMTSRLTSNIMRNALKEAEKYYGEDILGLLNSLSQLFGSLGSGMEIPSEKEVSRDELIQKISGIADYGWLAEELIERGEEIRKKQKRSSIYSLGLFLDSWKGDEEGYARILSGKGTSAEPVLELAYKCLDPSLVSGKIISESHSVILMSGTLTPTSMHRDILGFPEDTRELELASPFPKKNRLNLIIPKTTTKYSKRSESQYRMIAAVCLELSGLITGNIAFFFPSYELRDRVVSFFAEYSEKRLFRESPGMSKEDRAGLIDDFKSCSRKGAILAAVASGSYGEGIDLPGSFLNGVVVVGLPLTIPDLETRKLIGYYDIKFRKGWDYGYVLPAITRAMQNAGRCIRSEKDKGVIVFLDERYTWNSYLRCFPKDMNFRITLDYKSQILDFLENS